MQPLSIATAQTTQCIIQFDVMSCDEHVVLTRLVNQLSLGTREVKYYVVECNNS